MAGGGDRGWQFGPTGAYCLTEVGINRWLEEEHGFEVCVKSKEQVGGSAGTCVAGVWTKRSPCTQLQIKSMSLSSTSWEEAGRAVVCNGPASRSSLQ